MFHQLGGQTQVGDADAAQHHSECTDMALSERLRPAEDMFDI